MKTRWLVIQRNVESTQAKGTLFCLQIGTTALHFHNSLRRADCRWKLELFTPARRFRWSDSAAHTRRKRKADKLGTQEASNAAE